MFVLGKQEMASPQVDVYHTLAEALSDLEDAELTIPQSRRRLPGPTIQLQAFARAAIGGLQDILEAICERRAEWSTTTEDVRTVLYRLRQGQLAIPQSHRFKNGPEFAFQIEVNGVVKCLRDLLRAIDEKRAVLRSPYDEDDDEEQEEQDHDPKPKQEANKVMRVQV